MTARVSAPSLGAAGYQKPGTWNAGVNYRWQYSDRHFVGDVDQEYRQKEGSEVINDISLVDFGVSYAISKRFTASLSIPFQFATRSTTIRDPRKVAGKFVNPSPYPAPNGTVNGAVIDRFTTSAHGLSDIKLLVTSWLLDPDHHKKANVSAGLGVLFPTGEKDAKDIFKVYGTNSAGVYEPRAVTQNVDNSIQPGAGAWGIIFDLYGFAEVRENLNVFGAGTYIATPQTTAGVQDRSPLTGTPQVWSVGDSYLARVGFGYTFLPKHGLTFTLGGRVEGTPAHDLIGSSTGRRRPGFGVSIEPGLVFAKNGYSASLTAPVALYRNREVSVPDEATNGHGDAAFADYMILFSLGKSF